MTVDSINTSNVRDFTEIVSSGGPITVSGKQGWKIQGFFGKLWTLLTGKDRRDAAVIQVFNRYLDSLERIPVSVNNAANRQDIDYRAIIQAAKAVKHRYRQDAGKRCQAQLSQLIERTHALKYRIETLNGGLKKSTRMDHDLRDQIEQATIDYRQNSPEVLQKELSDYDRHQITTACRYPKLAKQILADARLRDRFMKWAIRGGLNVDIFAQFPSIQARLSGCYLRNRIARVGKQHLQLIRTAPRTVDGSAAQIIDNETNSEYKAVTLSMEGRRVNILDGSKTYTFQNNYTLPIHKIEKIFCDKNFDPGNLEFAENGVINWHLYQYGAYDPATNSYQTIDLDRERWWEQLPVFGRVNAEDMRLRYGRQLHVDEYAAGAIGGRTTIDRNALGCHGWSETFVPDQAAGNHKVYPIGMLADYYFPRKPWEFLKIAGGTSKAGIACPDENWYFLHRQQGGTLTGLRDEAHFRQWMNLVRDEIVATRNGQRVFQFLGMNCLGWVQGLFDKFFGEHHVPRFGRHCLWNAQVDGPLKWIYRPIQALPFQGIRRATMWAVMKIFGGMTHSVTKTDPISGHERKITIFNSRPWNEEYLDSPALLVERARSGHFARHWGLV